MAMTRAIRKPNSPVLFRRRVRMLVVLFCAAVTLLTARAVQLQVLDSRFLADQGEARHLRVAKISAHRGAITDRHGEPLAVSTPVDSIWAEPRELARAAHDLPRLAAAIDKDSEWLIRRITSSLDREFVYLRRHMRPEDAARVLAMDIPGVHVLREYRRYYPAGEVTGHVVGFTNIDDVGQEGLELAYDHWLAAESGSKRVLRDRLGRLVEDIEILEAPRPGKTLVTSLDLRIQYLAYRELKAAVHHFGALSGSAVVMDVANGEVLAMVNQPSYNPNDRAQYSVSRYRNRAATDILEPGSSFKPFLIAAALQSGRFQPNSSIDTTPGFVTVGAKTISDDRNLGTIDVTKVLTKSSNVGVIKIALSLEPEYVWRVLARFGFGRVTASGFPGESAGLLNHYAHWRAIGLATLAYGYGLSVTPLQLAQGYSIIGSRGLLRPASLVRVESAPKGERVVDPDTAEALVAMMETVVAPGGTGARAALDGYRVAGKTGTAWKYATGGYSEDQYVAVFAGLVPASNPSLAVVVVIDEPKGDVYYGGEVAAPLFARIVSGALRLLAIPPDDLSRGSELTIIQAKSSR